jgi:hypothetical protein
MIYEPVQVYEGDGVDRAKSKMLFDCFVHGDGEYSETCNTKRYTFNGKEYLYLWFEFGSLGYNIFEKYLRKSFSNEKNFKIRRIYLDKVGTFFSCMVFEKKTEKVNFGEPTDICFCIKCEKFRT